MWKVIDTPRATYFFQQKISISGLNQSDLEEIFHALIAHNFTEKFMIPHYYNDNIPSILPANKVHSNRTKPSLADKNHTGEPNKHRDAQFIRHRLAEINKKLVNPWGPPLF